jgi:hypothetical protein
MGPWKKKIILKKWMERSDEAKLCLTGDRLAN